MAFYKKINKTNLDHESCLLVKLFPSNKRLLLTLFGSFSIETLNPLLKYRPLILLFKCSVPKNKLSVLLIKCSVDESSLYGPGERSTIKNISKIIATITSKTTTNIVESLNPITSYKAPLAVGPIKAPKANTDVHKPEIKPYVSMLSGRPPFIELLKASVKLDTRTAEIPSPCKTNPTMTIVKLLWKEKN